MFFVIDDLGYSDLGYRHETYPNVSIGTPFPTPAIDALAMGGVRLERCVRPELAVTAGWPCLDCAKCLTPLCSRVPCS